MSDYFEKHLLGKSGEFCTVIRAARIAAITDVTLLLLGESGTGKELLAQAIHQHSSRADKPFIAINCAALPETLAESELFGHRKGAFTGAITDQQGRIQAANGGTLFLDEIGELPLNIQAKLLRFLETGECQVIGKTQIEKINTRILAATNRDLYTQAQQGKFRQDLYYRLNIVPLELPPLRKRIDDLEMLLQTFTKQLAQHHRINLKNFEIKMIKQALQKTYGNRSQAARLLGLTRDAFLYRIQKIYDRLFLTL